MKDTSRRSLAQHRAEALVVVALKPDIATRIADSELERLLVQTDIEAVASLAAKQHAQIFPAAHNVLVDSVGCVLEPLAEQLRVHIRINALSKTPLRNLVRFVGLCVGAQLEERFEQEDPGARILDISLVGTGGGRKHAAATFERQLTAAVIVLSDSRAAGIQSDESGPQVSKRLEDFGLKVVHTTVIPDDPDALRGLLLRYADEQKLDCVVTTGGTGLGPRDSVPEVTRAVIDRDIPGVSEAIRAHGQERTPFSMLSRGMAGVRGGTLILNLPGSPAGVTESLDAVMPEVLHIFKMMAGKGHA